MATARARRETGRSLSAAERRWLLGQMARRGKRDPAAAEVAAEAEEASSVIVRPERAASDPPAPPGKGAAPEHGAFIGPTLLAGLQASPALEEPESAAPPRLADRAAPATESPMAPGTGPMIPRYSTRDAHRAAPAVDLRRYRAVFACCCDQEQAREAPTEQSPSG